MFRREFIGSVGSMLALAGTVGCSTPSPAMRRAADAFRERMKEIETGSGGRLGVAVLDTQTGVLHSWRGDERFPMASTFKLSLAALVLSRTDQGIESLQRRIVFEKADLVAYSPVTDKRVGGSGMSLSELCEATVTWSDNGAANLIMKTVGGPEGLTSFFRKLGDRESRLDRWEPELNTALPGDLRDTTTPKAMLATVQRIVLGDGLSPTAREQMTAWLLANKVGDAKIRAGVPSGSRVADKTGGGGNGTNNDIGVIWLPGRAPLVLTCYLTGTAAESKVRDAAIANVAKVVTDSRRS